jgi:hypothetical protein
MSDETPEMAAEEARTVEPAGSAMVSRPFFWGALTIMLIWIAVLFIGVFAETHFRAELGADQVEVPVVWGIGLLAVLATWVVSVYAFKQRR